MAYNQAYKYHMVESRNPDGSLNFTTSSPFVVASEDDLFNFFFKEHPLATKATIEEMENFFASKGWFLRPKTWDR